MWSFNAAITSWGSGITRFDARGLRRPERRLTAGFRHELPVDGHLGILLSNRR